MLRWTEDSGVKCLHCPARRWTLSWWSHWNLEAGSSAATLSSPKRWRQPKSVDSGILSLLRHLDKTEGNSSYRSGVRRFATRSPADRQGAPGTEGNAGWGGKEGEGSDLWSHLQWESRQTEHPNAKQRCTVRSVPKYTRLGLYLKLPLTLSIGSCYFCYSNFGVVDIVLRAGVVGVGGLTIYLLWVSLIIYFKMNVCILVDAM